MKVVKELLTGCWLLEPLRFEDPRGRFVKTYHEELYAQLGVKLDIREEFYSVSHKDVIRGMHFQLPPHAHDKLVYCPQGAVCDVLLDLRAGAGYGRVAYAELSGQNCQLIFIPKGIAHGFVALDHNSLMIYKTSTVHNPESDCGIRWDSFGFDWGVSQPCLSDRDQRQAPMASFLTPF
jgi:dTDP-4-dehydrorhamnose 3,5-epimerase/CDP-3, 6-dideoxy-D-glycero-D-glycero-4-hexulose-5-epimerase